MIINLDDCIYVDLKYYQHRRFSEIQKLKMNISDDIEKLYDEQRDILQPLVLSFIKNILYRDSPIDVRYYVYSKSIFPKCLHDKTVWPEMEEEFRRYYIFKSQYEKDVGKRI